MNWLRNAETRIAILAIAAIVTHLVLRYVAHVSGTVAGFATWDVPLLVALVLGGIPLVLELLRLAWNREFGSDLLAGISIVTSVILGEYLAGTLVVLMLSGGQALENYAVRSASSVLEALARRMPTVAHRRRGGSIEDVPLDDVRPDDEIAIVLALSGG